jgi:hypothetical protein
MQKLVQPRLPRNHGLVVQLRWAERMTLNARRDGGASEEQDSAKTEARVDSKRASFECRLIALICRENARMPAHKEPADRHRAGRAGRAVVTSDVRLSGRPAVGGDFVAVGQLAGA